MSDRLKTYKKLNYVTGIPAWEDLLEWVQMRRNEIYRTMENEQSTDRIRHFQGQLHILKELDNMKEMVQNARG